MLNGKVSWIVFALSAVTLAIAQPEPVHMPMDKAYTHLAQHPGPKEPAEAQKQHLSGTVIVQVRISPSGEVHPIRVVSGHPLLAQAAMQEVQSWKYEPFLIDGVPAEVITEVPVQFLAASSPPVWQYLFTGAMSAFVVIAFARRVFFRSTDAHWRSTLSLIAVFVVSASWLQILAEVFYRRVLDLPYNLGSPWFAAWVGVNLYACLLAAIFSLVGKGPGRIAAFLAAPMLVFTWAIHYAV